MISKVNGSGGGEDLVSGLKVSRSSELPVRLAEGCMLLDGVSVNSSLTDRWAKVGDNLDETVVPDDGALQRGSARLGVRTRRLCELEAWDLEARVTGPGVSEARL